MKIDAQAGAEALRAPVAAASGDAGSTRWLAQLEHAYLASLDRHPVPAQPHDAAPAARIDGGPPLEDASAADLGDARGAAVREPVLAASTATAVPVPTERGQPSDALVGAIRRAAVDDVPGLAGVACRGPAGARADAPATSRYPSAVDERMAIPRYARQYMHLATTDDVSRVTVRDATLSGATAEGVARAIAAQLRDDGRSAVRVFVNGRRFDFSGPAAPQEAARRAPPRPDQEA